MNKTRGQLNKFLWVLFGITIINSAFYWDTQQKLYSTYDELTKEQKILYLAQELKSTLLDNNHKSIRENIKNLRSLIDDKHRLKLLNDFQKSWNQGKNSHHNQLSIFSQALIENSKKIITPLDDSAHVQSKTSIIYLGIYTAMFGFTILLIMSFMKRRIFFPLQRLLERMQNYNVGDLQPEVSDQNSELGTLEKNFIGMARQVSQTVSKMKELDQVKTDFISIASHELRTPMTSIKGSLSMALSGVIGSLTPDLKNIITIADKEADRLIRLINDILDLTKIEARKMPINKQWCDFEKVIENSVRAMIGFLDVAKVKLEVQPPEYSVEINIDKDRIQQVITNLLSNAIKFSPLEGTVLVRYEVIQNDLYVSIVDEGPGIKNEDKGHLFEKFQSKTINGTGLGLPICKALVEQHGGTIGARTAVNQGSTFYFSLPGAKIISQTLREVA